MITESDIRPIRSSEDLDRMVSLLEHAPETMTPREAELFEIVAVLVEAYDQQFRPEKPKLRGRKLIQWLLKANGLTQGELATLLETKQPNVSAILRGKRPINREQAERLSRRFSVIPEAFLT